MRKRLSPQILVGICVVLNAQFSFADSTRPAFLILSDEAPVPAVIERMETLGIRVFSQVPPSILTVDVPPGVDVRNVLGIQTVYQTAVPVSALEPLGTIAIAAGIQWNRALLASSRSGNAGSFGATRSLVSQRSLRAPTNLSTSLDGPVIALAWAPVASAMYYEVEAATDRTFLNRVFATKTAHPTVNAPALPEVTSGELYFRVRAVSHADDENRRENNVFGAWSDLSAVSFSPTAASNSLTPPILTSPLSDYESSGFTLILEWLATGASRYRVQTALDESFTNPFTDTITTEKEFTCPAPAMQVGDTFYWRVRAWDDAKSDWTAPRRFKIGPPHSEHPDFFINPEAPK